MRDPENAVAGARRRFGNKILAGPFHVSPRYPVLRNYAMDEDYVLSPEDEKLVSVK